MPLPLGSKSNFAIITNMLLLLCATAKTNSELMECKKTLEHARQVLRVQSRSFEICRFALLRIDAVFWASFDKVLSLQNMDM